MLPPRCGATPGMPVPFGPGGRGRGRRPRATAGDESGSSKPRWSDALETAQAKAAQAAQATMSAAKGVRAAAAEHPLGSKSLELSSSLWQKLPQGARNAAPGVAGGVAILTVAAVARSRSSRNPGLAQVRSGHSARGVHRPIPRCPDAWRVTLTALPAFLLSVLLFLLTTGAGGGSPAERRGIPPGRTAQRPGRQQDAHQALPGG